MLSRRIGAYVRQHHLVLFLVFIVLGGTAIAAGERGLQQDAISACVKKKSSALSLAKGGKCPKKSKPISWNQTGPQGPAGTNGANGTNGSDGAQGPAGTAVAYGRVNSDGTLTQASGVSAVSNPQQGIYCVTAPGANPSQRPMVVNTEYNGASQTQGTANFVDAVNIVQGSPSATGTAQWDSIPNFCAADQYEVRTVKIKMDSNAESFGMGPENLSFSFAVL